jgi:polysaccharide biosynthesis protein PslG
VTRKAITPRRTLAGLAITGAAAAVLALPSTGAGAVAAVQDDVLAIAPLNEIPARVDLVKRTKAKVTRVDILWNTVAPTRPANPKNPNDPAYDWSRTDAIFTALSAAKVRIIVSTYSTPDWAVAGKNPPRLSQYNPNAPRPADYAKFMRAVAKRYSGTFRPPGAGAKLPRVRHFEIWNEPNLIGFFRYNGRSSLPRYKALVKAAYPQIKAVNRKAVVIAGVGGPRSSTGGGNIGARRWMNSIVGDKRVKFDAYSQHVYPSKGPRFRSKAYAKAFPTWDSLPQIYATLNKRKKGMKLYITEAGYTTAKTRFRNVRVTFGQQKTYLKQIFALPTVRNPQLAAVVWFNLQDNADWPAGLLKASGAKKPSYKAFVAQARKPIPRALRSTFAR